MSHANIFYPVIVFSHFSLQPLLLCTRSQQCFITQLLQPSGRSATLKNLNTDCRRIATWHSHLLAANGKLVEKKRVLAVVMMTEWNCLLSRSEWFLPWQEICRKYGEIALDMSTGNAFKRAQQKHPEYVQT